MSGMGVLHRGTLVARFFEPAHASGMANPQLIEDCDEFPLGSMVQSRVEAETAFVLEKDFAGPGVDLGRK
jgi:2-keto-4-pentenoate hydratase